MRSHVYGALAVVMAALAGCRSPSPSSSTEQSPEHALGGSCGGVRLVTLRDLEDLTGTSLWMRASGDVDLTSPMWIAGPPGLCQLRDVTTGGVVFTVTLPEQSTGASSTTDDEQNWVSVSSPVPLTPGHTYRWEHLTAGVEPSMPFFPVVRYGSPSLEAAFDGGHVSVSPATLAVPIRVGGLSVMDVAVSSTAPTPASFRCYLNVAFADPSSTTDPVLDLGNGRFVLRPQVTLGPELLTVHGEGEAHFPIEIADARLVGRRMLWQLLLLDEASGTVLATDVVGSHVMPSDSAGPAAAPLLTATENVDGAAHVIAKAREWKLPVCSTLESRLVLSAAIEQLRGN